MFFSSQPSQSDLEARKDSDVDSARPSTTEPLATEPLATSPLATGPSTKRVPTHSGACASPPSWQRAMKLAIRSTSELWQRLGLPPEELPTGVETFPTFVPLELLRRIRPGDPNDPILRQVAATAREVDDVDGFVSDPVGDLQSMTAPGLLHKYHGRVLLVTTGACAVHCRYCFRREFPYSQSAASRNKWQTAIDSLSEDSSISEVLLSGGDPLTLSDDVLANLLDEIEAIGHVRRLRIHTRLPIVIPQRITDTLVHRLRDSRLTIWMVVHSNHGQEWDRSVTDATDRLIDGGIPVLNQAVLLRGVNDSVAALSELCEKLVDHRIQPYYLHHLDPVRGAAHFSVSVEKGKRLVEQLRQKLPGYAIPQYVAEFPGRRSKTPLS